MGFFSKVRKRIKKIIPKEIRPFIPYAAALIPGGMGLTGGLAKFGGSQFLKAGIARALTDDEADLKDILRTGAFAAAPTAIGEGLQLGSVNAELAGKMKTADYLGRGADYVKGIGSLKTVAGQGALDASIKAAELNEDALERYNRELAEQGINDKAGRRAAIRSIYANTGTWDMDEVDGMLDTYGYRTGGRVGYAIGDVVDTEQITEDLGNMGGAIKKGIGSIGQMNKDAIDRVIELLLNLPGPIKSGREIIQILVERYGVDPEIAQRKIINRMSDSNEGFGPQGLDGTPDDGYRRNIGIDAGAEDYYGETPAMPENLGDMGGNMDDMSGNSILNRLRRGQEYEEEAMPEDRFNPYSKDMPRPDMKQMPLPLDYEPKYERMPLPLDYEPKYTPMMSGGRVGYEGGDLVDMEDVILASTKGKKSEEETYFDEEGGDISMAGVVKGEILGLPAVKKKKRKSKEDSKKDDEDLLDNIGAMQKSYSILYPEVKENRIRPLSFEDGGSVDDRLMERVKELQDEGLDFASALAQAMKEDMAANKARGGIMDGIDINMEEQIDTPRGDIMIDENIKVADSSLMDAYEIYKFDMMEQGLEPMSIEEFRDQAMAEGKMANMDYREFIYDASRDNFANDMFGKDYGDLNEEETEEVDAIIEMELGKNQAAPERTMAASGGLMNLGGREMDLRGGGFVPMGAKERADDVPARLSKNEFVMTADAVRAAGGGSVQKGADLMYDQMKQLEGQA